MPAGFWPFVPVLIGALLSLPRLRRNRAFYRQGLREVELLTGSGS